MKSKSLGQKTDGEVKERGQEVEEVVGKRWELKVETRTGRTEGDEEMMEEESYT